MLKVQDLTVGYGGATVLHGVSVAVSAGQVVTLIGPNGVGKSTLLRTISGLLQPTSGQIWFEQRNVAGDPVESIVRAGVIQVPEGRRVFGSLTVYENLLMGGFMIRDSALLRRRIAEVYTLFPRLAERKHQLAGTMSGGERQMLAIGRALMAGPKLLLLDEPSMGLAPQLVDRVKQIVREIHERGISILLVEQNATLALDVASYCYVMQTGRIVASGATDDVRHSDALLQSYLGAPALSAIPNVASGERGV